MRVTKQIIKADIEALFRTLEPYGITKPIHLARLMRDPADPSYPSDGYIRLMLSDKSDPQPSERFCELFYVLSDYVRAEVAQGAPGLAVLAEGINPSVASRYRPAERIRFVTLPDNVDIGEIITANSNGPLLLAVIPSSLARHCQWPGCGRVFPGVPSARYCCPEHRRTAARERRRSRAAETNRTNAVSSFNIAIISQQGTKIQGDDNGNANEQA